MHSLRTVVFRFFFSSRRRHTRWPRDWSSDVCSSDLNIAIEAQLLAGAFLAAIAASFFTSAYVGLIAAPFAGAARSEERRVGKECRARWRRGPRRPRIHDL